ncbi:MAG: TrkA family potassium uptake protein [Anaerolineales bacterium]|nr:TrkA family potassium uptake protein [Anaerolineales bacterium]
MTDQHKLSWSQQIWQNLKSLTSFKTGQKLTRRINGNNYNKEFIVIGLGRFGTSLAMTLNAYEHEVLALDLDMKRVQYVSQVLPHVFQLDATNIDALREIGADAFHTGVVCIGTDFEANLLATVNLRKLGVHRVITKAITVTQQDILSKIGADEVVLPEHEAGVRLARRLAAIDFVDFMELSEDKGVVEIITPRRLIGKSLKESQIRQKYGLAVVAIRRENDVIISPRAEEIIKEHDILVVLGRITNCEKLREEPVFTTNP